MARDIDDPDLTLAELFGTWPAAVRPFLRHGTGCVGCPIAPFHRICDTCAQYGLDEARFRAEIRAAIAPRRRSAPRAGAERPR